MNDPIPLLALKTLSALGVTSLHGLKSLNLLRSRYPGFLVDSFSAFRADTSLPPFPDDITGLSVTRGDTKLILYRDGMQVGRRNFTIAHELGHLLLRHTSADTSAEREADCFAESLLIPSSFVVLLERKTGKRLLPEDMLRYFPVSLSVCRIKRREMDLPSFPFPTEAEFRIAEPFFNGTFSSDPYAVAEKTWLDPDMK